MKKEKDLIAKPWAKISQEWKNTVTPPLSPSPDDLAIYRKWIEKKYLARKDNSDFNVLILGSTREVRDLFGKYKDIKVYVCDINHDHYLAMSKLTKSAKKDEEFILSEWSVAPLKRNFFDIIIGDGIISNVASENKHSFMRKMKSSLKLDGLMVIREVSMYAERFLGIDEMLRFFEQYKIDSWSPMELLISLELAVYDPKTGKVSLPKIVKYLRSNYYNKKTERYIYPQKDIEILLNHPALQKWLAINKEWVSCSYQEMEKFIKKYFVIKMKEHALDHLAHPTCGIFGDIMPIFILAPKNK